MEIFYCCISEGEETCDNVFIPNLAYQETLENGYAAEEIAKDDREKSGCDLLSEDCWPRHYGLSHTEGAKPEVIFIVRMWYAPKFLPELVESVHLAALYRARPTRSSFQ